MRIGVDFDNTIVRYDELFHSLALNKKLIPADLPVTKSAVRDHLRSMGQEDLWTEMQGEGYGPAMRLAKPFEGVKNFFRLCVKRKIPIFIISHKTQTPYRGPAHNLHESATKWLLDQGFFDPAVVGLPREAVFFELSKEEKLKRIAAQDCTHFIDDLPEFLLEAEFPLGTQRILFDPTSAYPDQDGVIRISSWDQASDLLLARRMSESLDAESDAMIRQLVADAKQGEAVEIQRLAPAGNNRGYRVRTKRSTVFVKAYFRDAADNRDRLAADYGFSRFAWDSGVRALPEPLWSDAGKGAAVYAFVEGGPVAAGDVGEDHVTKALDFWSVINQYRASGKAQSLPAASEACFSTCEHIECIGKRVERLGAIEGKEDVDEAARGFIRHRLTPTWNRIVQKLEAAGEESIGNRERCLSPSDFGFHNALRTEAGRLIFHDFEYAGWDDPAKLVGDFFCQPRVPVPGKFRAMFVDRVMRQLELPPAHEKRIARLAAAHRLKWCCIMLNEFVPAGARRRQFAHTVLDFSARKRYQLEQAQQLLDRNDPWEI